VPNLSTLAGWLADPRQFVPTIIAVGESPGGTFARASPAGINSAYAKQLLAEAENMAHSIWGADLRAEAMVTVRTAAARNAPEQALPLLTEAEQFARTISRDSARFDALEEVALAAARTVPALAEQFARSLRHLQDKVPEIALAITLTDAILAERIAATIVDEYWHDFVLAVIAIRTDPANARSLLITAEKAARGKPYYLRSVAMVTNRIDPAHAEQIARGMRKLAITLGPGLLGSPGADRSRELAPANQRGASRRRGCAENIGATMKLEQAAGKARGRIENGLNEVMEALKCLAIDVILLRAEGAIDPDALDRMAGKVAAAINDEAAQGFFQAIEELGDLLTELSNNDSASLSREQGSDAPKLVKARAAQRFRPSGPALATNQAGQPLTTRADRDRSPGTPQRRPGIRTACRGAASPAA